MSKLKRIVLWSCLALIVLLIVLSIYGAFLGAEQSKRFFNCLPTAFYWVALVGLIVAGFWIFPRLTRVPSLLLMHAGCIFILAGAIWGSQAGHELQKKLFSVDKIRAGQMVIYEQTSENRVMLEDSNEVRELPFLMRLKEFRIEYNQPYVLLIETQDGRSWRIPARVDSDLDLGRGTGRIKVLQTFENFKIRIEGDKHVAINSAEPGLNPALEVQIEEPNGVITTRFVFERFGGHPRPEDKFFMKYIRIIRDYVSELEVIKNNKVVAAQAVKLNHPLHYGGYHFHQHAYDAEAGRYTVLMVASDSGLNVVYAGFAMLCVGALWHFWLRHSFHAHASVGMAPDS
jgi:hypothetical protein